MRFFSKIVFICNLCFIAAVILRWITITGMHKGNKGEALTFQPLVSTLVILGYGAIVVNFIFNIICLLLFVSKSARTVVRWMIWFNFLLLIIQVWYFDLLSVFK